LNRIDEVIVFHALNLEQIGQIVSILLGATAKKLKQREMTLEVTDTAKQVIIEQGYDPTFGARPLRRAIQRLVENPISSAILRGEFKEGDAIVLDADASGKLIPRLRIPGFPREAQLDEPLAA